MSLETVIGEDAGGKRGRGPVVEWATACEDGLETTDVAKAMCGAVIAPAASRGRGQGL